MPKKALIVADIHYPHYDRKVFDILKEVGSDLQPDYLVILGDMVDANGISKFTNKNWREGFWDTVQELKAFSYYYYKPLVDACGSPEVRICRGNHDGRRFEHFFEKMKEKEHKEDYKHYLSQVDFSKHFPDAVVTDYNDCQNIGKLYMTHGEYHGVHHTKQHAVEYGKNIIYGHLHTYDVKTIKTKATKKIKTAYSIPCAMRLGIDYMKNKSSSWVQGFAVGYFFKNGDYHLEVKTILSGRTVLNGKTYGE